MVALAVKREIKTKVETKDDVAYILDLIVDWSKKIPGKLPDAEKTLCLNMLSAATIALLGRGLDLNPGAAYLALFVHLAAAAYYLLCSKPLQDEAVTKYKQNRKKLSYLGGGAVIGYKLDYDKMPCVKQMGGKDKIDGAIALYAGMDQFFFAKPLLTFFQNKTAPKDCKTDDQNRLTKTF